MAAKTIDRDAVQKNLDSLVEQLKGMKADVLAIAVPDSKLRIVRGWADAEFEATVEGLESLQAVVKQGIASAKAPKPAKATPAKASKGAAKPAKAAKPSESATASKPADKAKVAPAKPNGNGKNGNGTKANDEAKPAAKPAATAAK